MMSSIIVNSVLWLVIVIIGVMWYLEAKKERQQRDSKVIQVHKNGIGTIGHLPGKYNATM